MCVMLYVKTMVSGVAISSLEMIFQPARSDVKIGPALAHGNGPLDGLHGLSPLSCRVVVQLLKRLTL